MGSSGSTDTSSQQQSVNQTQLPPWVNQAAQQNYGLAQNIAERPLTQYQGQQVADIGPQTQQAWNLAAQSGGAGADQYNASQAGFLTAAGTPATQVNAQSLANTNLQPYMNPFTQSVINTTMPLMQQQNALSQNQAANQANSANAFGGSRQGVQQGVAQAQGALNIGQMASQLNQANFDQAQQAATGDITRNLQAQTSNQGANQANINSLIQAAGGLGTLGSQAQQNQRQQFLELSTAGAGQQPQAQNQIAANMGQFNQAQQYPLPQLGILQSGLHDALRLDLDWLQQRAAAADDDPVADGRHDRRLAGAGQPRLGARWRHKRAGWVGGPFSRTATSRPTSPRSASTRRPACRSTATATRATQRAIPRLAARWPRTRCRSRRTRSGRSACMGRPGRRSTPST